MYGERLFPDTYPESDRGARSNGPRHLEFSSPRTYCEAIEFVFPKIKEKIPPHS